MCNFDFLISVKTRAYIWCDDSVIGRYSFKRGVCLKVLSSIFPLLVYEYII